MNAIDAKQWLAVFSDPPDDLRAPCKYGHKECSTTTGGECLDDVIKAAIPPEG